MKNTIAAIVATALLTLGVIQLQSSRETRQAILKAIIEERSKMVTYEADVRNLDNLLVHVSVTRNEGETAAQHLARFQAECYAIAHSHTEP